MVEVGKGWWQRVTMVVAPRDRQNGYNVFALVNSAKGKRRVRIAIHDYYSHP